MSKRRKRTQAAPPAAPTVDLRAAARALLTGERVDPLALRPEALARIVAIARADEPIIAPAPEAAVGRNGSSPSVRAGVAVIRLQGIITPQGSWLSLLFGGEPGGLQGFRRELREALGSEDVNAIVLDVHSPGGLISLVPETAAELRAARGDKPIIAVANTLMASAAYWIGAQADELVVTPSGLAGSIGVYLVHEDWSGFNAELGVMPTYISAGRYKVEANFDEPLSEEAKAALQAEVDDLYGLFVDDVAAGRGVSPQAVRDGLGEGRVLPAERAVQAGLGDRVATVEDVIRELANGGRDRGRARSSAPPREGDNPEPNGRSEELPEEVRARIAELATVGPPGTY
jgi:signal peptide peptidase SppA